MSFEFPSSGTVPERVPSSPQRSGGTGTRTRRTFEPCANASCRKPVAVDHTDGPASLLCVEHLLIATGIDLSVVDGVPRVAKPSKRQSGKPAFIRNAERQINEKAFDERKDVDSSE